MLFPSFGLKKGSRSKSDANHITFDDLAVDNEFKILSEDKFREILGMEINRINRSGRPFLLMLINVEKFIKNSDGGKIITRIINEIRKNTRDTDIKGWYEHGCSIGVILTETNGFDLDLVAHCIQEKIDKRFCTFLNLSQLDELEISFKVFPENSGGKTSVNPSTIKLNSSLIGQSTVNKDIEDTVDSDKAESTGEQKTKISASKLISNGSIEQMLLLLGGDLLIISLVNFSSVWLRLGSPINVISVYTGACAISLVFYVCAFYIFGLYNMARSFQSWEIVGRAAIGVFFAGGLTACFYYMIPQWQFGRGIFLVQIILLAVLISFWRLVYGKLFQKNIQKKGALILGAGKSGRVIYRLLNGPLSPYQVKGFLDDAPSNYGNLVDSALVLGTIDQLPKVAEKVWIKSAILATPRNASPEMIRQVLDARFQGLEVIEMATVYERLTGRVPVRHIEDQWLLFADGFYLISKEHIQRLKRLIDIIVSSGMLLCCFPIMALTGLLIRIDSPGSIFYKQERVGKNGRVFCVVKFRSMVKNAESKGAEWCEKGDSRVTRVGHWIRKFRIDELPQLWNVLLGHMSLIGPRPERPEFVKDLETRIPYYGARHAVTPGISGWAQVNYPYGASVEDALQKLEYDLYYIKNMSLFLDLRIALKTIGVVILGDGAR